MNYWSIALLLLLGIFTPLNTNAIAVAKEIKEQQGILLVASSATEASANKTTEKTKDSQASTEHTAAAKAKDSSDKEEKEDETPAREKQYEEELAKLNFEKAKLEHKKEMLEIESAIQVAEEQKQLSSIEADKRRLELENELTEQRVRKEQLKQELRKVKPEYLRDPYQNGQLLISDRRITLNSVIYAEVADEITQYIHYFNNQSSEYPIFLVIDRCLGGSVMEGARILEAMRNSKAPVYVVVKSIAASMGAVIATLAERSFAYPNAILVHHQMISVFYGNNTQVTERLKINEEWAERLMKPVAQKMGLSIADFVAEMYKHNTEGNWIEFANNAQKLGWITNVVSAIQETSYTEAPEKKEEETTDNTAIVVDAKIAHLPVPLETNVRQYQLPPLAPGDFYHLYDPYKVYHQ